MNEITLILPYYRNPEMLVLQSHEWDLYPDHMRVVVVDDGSPEGERAVDVLPVHGRGDVYQIEVDIPWNRNGARNTGAKVADTEWLLHTDIDHLLTGKNARALIGRELDPTRWYKFSRFRVGKADATRQKDTLPEDAEWGPIKPHVDSFLCTREMYWAAGGYDEDFSGGLGGSSLFLHHMANEGPCELLEDVSLRVYTTHACPDASDVHLSRDRSRYARIRAEKRAAGDPKPASVCRQPYRHVR